MRNESVALAEASLTMPNTPLAFPFSNFAEGDQRQAILFSGFLFTPQAQPFMLIKTETFFYEVLQTIFFLIGADLYLHGSN